MVSGGYSRRPVQRCRGRQFLPSAMACSTQIRVHRSVGPFGNPPPPRARLAGNNPAERPRAIGGGFWASTHRFRLEGQPQAVPSDVMFCIAPDAAMGAKEADVQQSVADLGDPTPHVRLRGPADSFLDGPWSVMDFAAGSLPLGDLNGLALLRRAPGCLPAYRSGSPRRWRPCTPSIPSRRARLLSRRHSAWPGGFQRGLGVEDLFGDFVSGAEVLGRADLADGCRMVADSRPAEVTTVICHGDLHPFHLLVDDGDQ